MEEFRSGATASGDAGDVGPRLASPRHFRVEADG